MIAKTLKLAPLCSLKIALKNARILNSSADVPITASRDSLRTTRRGASFAGLQPLEYALDHIASVLQFMLELAVIGAGDFEDEVPVAILKDLH
jgi:hypothetical protein